MTVFAQERIPARRLLAHEKNCGRNLPAPLSLRALTDSRPASRGSPITGRRPRITDRLSPFANHDSAVTESCFSNRAFGD